MSNDVENNFALLNIKFPESADEALKGITQKPSKEIGTTLADIWFVVFGGISELAEKRRIKTSCNLEAYKKQIEQNIEEIPIENLQEPKLQIVGPALEKSKYCVDETEIRDMFARLIASSMDSRYSSIVHPSFTEIIAQMSPLDAENLSLFTNGIVQLPLVQYLHVYGNDSFVSVLTDVFLENPNNDDIKTQASSISALCRLGLVNISYENSIAKESSYSKYYEHEYWYFVQEEISPLPPDAFQSPRDDDKIVEASVVRGIVKLTPLGKDFVKVCLGK